MSPPHRAPTLSLVATAPGGGAAPVESARSLRAEDDAPLTQRSTASVQSDVARFTGPQTRDFALHGLDLRGPQPDFSEDIGFAPGDLEDALAEALREEEDQLSAERGLEAEVFAYQGPPTERYKDTLLQPTPADFYQELEESGVFRSGPLTSREPAVSIATSDSQAAYLEKCRALEDAAKRVDESREDPAALCDLADARLALGAPRGAEGECTRALRAQPSYVRAHVLRARVRHEMGNLEGAARDVRRALKINPRSAPALIRSAQIRIDTKDHTNAIADLDRAIMIDSADPFHYKLRAAAKHAHFDLEGAIDDLSVAIAMAPWDADALFQRGTLRESLGRAGASTDLNRASLIAAQNEAD